MGFADWLKNIFFGDFDKKIRREPPRIKNFSSPGTIEEAIEARKEREKEREEEEKKFKLKIKKIFPNLKGISFNDIIEGKIRSGVKGDMNFGDDHVTRAYTLLGMNVNPHYNPLDVNSVGWRFSNINSGILFKTVAPRNIFGNIQNDTDGNINSIDIIKSDPVKNIISTILSESNVKDIYKPNILKYQGNGFIIEIIKHGEGTDTIVIRNVLKAKGRGV